MKEFLADFQVDTEHKEIAGVCAGIANYFKVDPLMVRALVALLFLSSIEISLLTVISYALLAGWMGSGSLEEVIKKSGYKILFFYIVSICFYDLHVLILVLPCCLFPFFFLIQV